MFPKSSRNVLNLVFRFLLELGALAALAYWGYQSGDGLIMQIGMGIGAPLLAALAWGTFRVPNDPGNAPVPVSGRVRLVIELVVFELAAAGLSAAGQQLLAWIFGAAVVVHYLLTFDRVLWLLRDR
jgi:hypothetical protein